ncbi:cytochrome c oxidase accessory protein CcoG [Sediminitomix flava]|uniref:Cytochrome c oxidase accessory protein FixG n=1 Tax=Sediminitomix flava TaxID=379075 RepID=A0A315Z8C9_SEDFL|nr:cytochrome c oxidase accessory protein CcoG [Sediminitomix flava]PWJ41006.1 cytochrome c oxidase accessory protein FixG [Sediminitomix flava]
MAAQQDNRYKEDFREAISTVDSSGKRIWVYPKKPNGKYYNSRKKLSYVLLVFLFVGPFIKIGGQPLLMLNVLERKFVIFGQLFLPHDFFIFVLTMIFGIIFIVLFTVVYGRLFCGWVCPQTIFMEMVFRRIEYWIEGDHNQQRKLDKAPWNSDKIFKRSAKYSLFFIVSFAIANTFLGYIVGGDKLIEMVTLPPTQNLTTFTALFIFTVVFYWVFAYLREQACTTICPYGRLQGVLLDKDSINVSYDFLRGEPRGKKRKKEENEAPKGDCIDCNLCVQVCPTGIDIRNGTQLECVNCTACIDACDAVMTKIDKPTGLIRYATHNEIENNKPFEFNVRMKAYTGVLTLLASVILFMLFSRSTTETTLLRAPGQLYYKTKEGSFRNLYKLKIVNKSHRDIPIKLVLTSHQDGEIIIVGEPEMVLEGESNIEEMVFIDLPPNALDGAKTKIEVDIYENENKIDHVSTSFLGPRS